MTEPEGSPTSSPSSEPSDAAGVDLGHYLPSIMANINTWPNKRLKKLLHHNWQALLEDMIAQNGK